MAEKMENRVIGDMIKIENTCINQIQGFEVTKHGDEGTKVD